MMATLSQINDGGGGSNSSNEGDADGGGDWLIVDYWSFMSSQYLIYIRTGPNLYQVHSGAH